MPRKPYVGFQKVGKLTVAGDQGLKGFHHIRVLRARCVMVGKCCSGANKRDYEASERWFLLDMSHFAQRALYIAQRNEDFAQWFADND